MDLPNSPKIFSPTLLLRANYKLSQIHVQPNVYNHNDTSQRTLRMEVVLLHILYIVDIRYIIYTK